MGRGPPLAVPVLAWPWRAPGSGPRGRWRPPRGSPKVTSRRESCRSRAAAETTSRELALAPLSLRPSRPASSQRRPRCGARALELGTLQLPDAHGPAGSLVSSPQRRAGQARRGCRAGASPSGAAAEVRRTAHAAAAPAPPPRHHRRRRRQRIPQGVVRVQTIVGHTRRRKRDGGIDHTMRRAAGAASSGVVGLGRAPVVPRPRSGARSRRRSRSA